MNCIKQAYNAFARGEIKYTGSMVHRVIPELDKGEVLETVKIPIYEKDTYDILVKRQKNAEKGIVISTIQTFIKTYNDNLIKDMLSNILNGRFSFN